MQLLSEEELAGEEEGQVGRRVEPLSDEVVADAGVAVHSEGVIVLVTPELAASTVEGSPSLAVSQGGGLLPATVDDNSSFQFRDLSRAVAESEELPDLVTL